MARQLFSNNAASNLVGTLSQGGTTLNLVTGTGDRFPAPTGGDYFLVTIFELDDDSGVETRFEVVKCTSRVGDQLTIVRDFEGMTNIAGGYSYPSAPGSTVYVQLRWTAGGANQFLQKGDSLAELEDPQAVRENLGITAANTPFSPTGSLAATTVQTAIAELDSEKQPVSQLLTSLANLTTSANKIAYFTGSNFAGLTDLSAFGRSVIGSSGELALRTMLLLENVDNTSDATKASAVGPLTNKTINLASNTLVATSAQLAAAVTDKTGSGSLAFANSPTLTGTPLTPTAAADTNTTQIASTAFVIGQGYLKSAAAASTYLTQSNAASTYLTQSNAASTYLSITNASSTYLTQSSALSTYLTQANAASTYLTTATASGTYQAVSAKGQANGYASLDSTGKVPSAQLPSFVDDVLEYANLAAFPGTGETAKIYVALDSNKTYRWSGSVYVEISASPGTSDALTEGSTNLYFTNTRARAAISVTQNLTYNAATGVITGPNLSAYLTGNQNITVSGDATGSGATSIALTLANSGVTAGSYSKVTVDAKGRVTAGLSMTSGDITTALGYTPPQPGGSGASGTWGISISGNAATATSAVNADTLDGFHASAFLGLAGGTMTGALVINNGSPTITLQDTDNSSAFIHCNGGIFYILRGGTNAVSWTQVNGYWPLQVDLSNNNMQVGGALTAISDVTAYSDESLKKDWEALPVDFVERLATVKHGTFTRIDTGARQVGVGAQSLKPLIPEAVKEQDGVLSVAYGNAALAAAVELAKRIVDLERKLEELENKE